MGVDAKLTLPPGTRIRHVANVAGMLLGQDHEMLPLGHGSKAEFLQLHGVSVLSADSQPDCARIRIEPRWHILWQYEWWTDGAGLPGSPGFMLRSRPEVLALFSRLGEFFGGWLDYRDNDEIECDASWPIPAPINFSDDEQWQAHQDRMSSVQPLTSDEIESFRPYAAYD
jgi:hypothetical protein